MKDLDFEAEYSPNKGGKLLDSNGEEGLGRKGMDEVHSRGIVKEMKEPFIAIESFCHLDQIEMNSVKWSCRSRRWST